MDPDPDPWGPKTCGSGGFGSGSGTLVESHLVGLFRTLVPYRTLYSGRIKIWPVAEIKSSFFVNRKAQRRFKTIHEIDQVMATTLNFYQRRFPEKCFLFWSLCLFDNILAIVVFARCEDQTFWQGRRVPLCPVSFLGERGRSVANTNDTKKGPLIFCSSCFSYVLNNPKPCVFCYFLV